MEAPLEKAALLVVSMHIYGMYTYLELSICMWRAEQESGLVTSMMLPGACGLRYAGLSMKNAAGIMFIPN